jgi:hypothetical protein
LQRNPRSRPMTELEKLKAAYDAALAAQDKEDKNV